MDFGIGFLSNNVMLPILDFFYGIVPSYGLAIVALTLVIRFALYPLSAGSIRNMRRMRVAQPAMQKRVKEIQARYKDDPTKQQEEMSKVYKEFGFRAFQKRRNKRFIFGFIHRAVDVVFPVAMRGHFVIARLHPRL